MSHLVEDDEGPESDEALQSGLGAARSEGEEHDVPVHVHLSPDSTAWRERHQDEKERGLITALASTCMHEVVPVISQKRTVC